MKADKHIATYRRLRTQPLWRLLSSTYGLTVIGLLQSHLNERECSLPASILFERLTRDLEELRIQGEDFPQTAQAYVANWLSDGYLERRFPPGATEEKYELSTAMVEAIRFLSDIAEPTSALDLLAQVEIARLLGDLRAHLGLSMIVISHDIGLIGRLTDRVAVMHQGRMVEVGATAGVLSALCHPYTERLLSSVIGLEEETHPAMDGVLGDAS